MSRETERAKALITRLNFVTKINSLPLKGPFGLTIFACRDFILLPFYNQKHNGVKENKREE